MLAAFGFSIGDFFAAVKAFKTVCVALKDHGGAATEYQEVSRELDAIQVVVKQLEELPIQVSPSNTEDDEVCKALAVQSNGLYELVKGFTARVRRYDPTLGAEAPEGFARRKWSKTKWALFFSPELQKFRLVVGTHASSITVSVCHLLYTHSIASENTMIKEHGHLQESFSSKLATVVTTVECNHATLENQNATVLQSLSDIATSLIALERQQLETESRFQQALAPMASSILNHLAELNSKLDGLLKGKQASNPREEIDVVNCSKEQNSVTPSGPVEEGRQLSGAELHTALRVLARQNLQKLHWDSSIVDLMKLFDLESGVYARGMLAERLGVAAGPPGSSPQNIALHKALMKELAKNGGLMPEWIIELVHM